MLGLVLVTAIAGAPAPKQKAPAPAAHGHLDGAGRVDSDKVSGRGRS
jgi:hypothetical protein